jgi:tetratricopeptide (TPR) repeat protein
MWTRLYPRDWIPLNGLSARYQVIGEYEKAAEAASRSIALQPDHYVGYANLAMSNLALGRFEDARKACELATSHHRDCIYTHRVPFDLAFLNHDEKGMEQQIDWAKGTERNNDMLGSVALAKIARGELRSAKQMFTQSWDALKPAGLFDDAAFSMAGEGVAEADFGNLNEAKRTARAAARVGRGVDARETAAEALALAGDVDRAGSLAEELHERFSLNRPLNAASLPTIYATIELQRGNPQKAIDILQPAIPFDFCEFSSLAAVYIRGQAFLRMGSGKDAAAEFRKIIDHPGIVATSQRHPLAHLGLARALVMQGEAAEARNEYQVFLTAWSEADQSIPALIQARSECKRLQMKNLAINRKRADR